MLISKIKQQYPNKLINTFNVVPSSLSNGNALDCFNTVLTLKSLAEEANGCFFFDNESLRSTCKNVMNIQNHDFLLIGIVLWLIGILCWGDIIKKANCILEAN